MSGNTRGDAFGYNQAAVEEIGAGINRIAATAGESIVNAIKANVVDRVAEEWVSEVAVKYFEDFKGELKSKESNVTDVFQKFSDKIQKAGEDWATETGGVAPVMPAVETVTLELDVSPIRAEDNGDRYIYEGLGDSVKGYVEQARVEIEQTLAQLQSEANAESAFFGGGQAPAIQEAAAELGTEVNQILDSLISGEGSLVTAIVNYRNEYSSTATGIASSFADSGFTE